MDWMLIFTMVIDAIMQCMENRSRPDIEASLRRPGALETLTLRRIIKQQTGLRGRALADAVAEGLAYGKSMPSEAIAAMMEEAEERVQAAAAADA
uniref:Uncharacterized protein n=1 Tax=viral metagenome TaxID=1070528 RepID=A0A6M3LRA0_9ZZZZ